MALASRPSAHRKLLRVSTIFRARFSPLVRFNYQPLEAETLLTIHPETRASLILRLGDPADDSAWSEFLQIYEPLLLRLATRWGLQQADALEVVQETLLAVAKAIPSFDRDQHAGAFRGWLAAITRNKLADHLSRARRRESASGDSDVRRWLDQVAGNTSDASVWDWNQKQQIYAWAAAKVQQQVSPSTWQAFHRTAVQGEPVAEVATDLQMREGMVYVARSRVMARLRKSVAQWQVAPIGEDGPTGNP
ncbi:RNA polymerase sigma factor [Allorhodopirellula solitaria]|uniref:RNA polymerase sigma factor n=1 Tax=Allorhodopirellula solitaria TaxID=2527987 RepID=A0A5C5XTH8_9BACT|nr:sigma-70 family RNA polymerase sigma factor [Allorhodopirellula solitaria]TWT66566.1 RNA polymerase sigma factor [Allorhodopirellula solitaria]